MSMYYVGCMMAIAIITGVLQYDSRCTGTTIMVVFQVQAARALERGLLVMRASRRPMHRSMGRGARRGVRVVRERCARRAPKGAATASQERRACVVRERCAR